MPQQPFASPPVPRTYFRWPASAMLVWQNRSSSCLPSESLRNS